MLLKLLHQHAARLYSKITLGRKAPFLFQSRLGKSNCLSLQHPFWSVLARSSTAVMPSLRPISGLQADPPFRMG